MLMTISILMENKPGVALQHIASHPEKEKVWFTRPSAIYDHCSALPASKFPPA